MNISLLTRCGALLTTLLAAVPTLANDASFIGVAGSPRLLQGEHFAIRMESERVILTMRADDKFSTDAGFVFVNDSSHAVTVQMGFPETNYGDGWDAEDTLGKKSGFETFSTTVNGQTVAAKRRLIKLPAGGEEVWWLKTVSFAPRERKNVRVMALSPLASSVDWAFNRSLAYNFTGGNWKGLVSRSDLEVRMPLRGYWTAVGSTYDGGEGYKYWKPLVTRTGETVILRKTWRNWQAQSQVQVGVRRVMPGWLLETDGNRLTMDKRALPEMVSFRVGALESAPPSGDVHAFAQNGVTMIAFETLAARAAELLPQGAHRKNWDAARKRAVLSRGAHTLAFTAGSKTMMVDNVKPVTLRAAAQLVRSENNGQQLYVPLAESARAFGLKVSVDATKHRLSIRK